MTSKPETKVKIPITINIIGWFGIVLAITYLLYGVISIILSILDRTYQDIGLNVLSLMYGLPILIISIGFRNLQRWGWIGFAAILAFMVIWSGLHITDVYLSVWGLPALAALIGIMTPSVRRYYFPA
jgi:amino acid permease